MSNVANYRVEGMTCGHCVSAVTSELSRLAGVSKVDVDLDTGSVAVTSATDLSAEEVRVAVEEAGYEVVS